jgi:hypothetical protein
LIVSHRHRFIFFAVPKTGTHSVRQALREHLGPEDIEQVGLFVQKQFPQPELASIKHGHLSVRQVAPVFGAEVFESYLKFAFVRNPFDRFVSFCAFMGRKTGEFERDPQRFMRFVVAEMRPVNHPLYKPQHQMLCDEQGRMRMDVIGRVETMQESYDAICARLGLASAPLGKVNSSSHRPFQEYYDGDLEARVAEVYQRDLDLFGYRFA